MRKCRVNAYLVEVRELNSRTPLKLGSFDGTTNLRDVVQKILNKYLKFKTIPAHKRTFKVTPNGGNTGPLNGFIHAGDFGYESDIIDTTKGAVSYKKTKSDSLTEPFYYHLALHPKETRGILSLQSWGNSGVKSLFDLVVSAEFGALYPNYRLEIRNLTTADALADYLKNGIVEEISVEKHEIPADIADRFGGTRRAYKGKFTYTIKPSDSNLFKRGGLIAYAKGKSTLDEIFDFDDNGFDVVKTKIKIGDETKTVNLTKPDTIAMSVDITNDVKVGKNGYPTSQSLADEFTKITADLARRGGIRL